MLTGFETKDRPPRAILIGITVSPGEGGVDPWAEFAALTEAAGIEEVGRVVQSRSEPDPALFIGSGKADDLAVRVRAQDCDLVVAMQELSPTQLRNLEERIGLPVLDRTDLILHIFAGRARTREGKLQVELARLQYLLPRLSGSVPRLSRLGGGIGTRGPGETKLEVDRRRVRRRITDIQHQLAEVERYRQVQRNRREKNQIPTIALVGYTNAGKSTLFNRLTDAGVPAANRLFETLDPVSRQLDLPGPIRVILLDTVGLVSDLPHLLVAAFKATLEETVRASLLVKVLDAAAPNFRDQYAAIQQVLGELGIPDKAGLIVLNKIDRVESPADVTRMAREWGALPVSALTGAGMEELIGILAERVTDRQTYQLVFSFQESRWLARLHQEGRVQREIYTETGIRVEAELDPKVARRFQQFIMTEESLC